MLDALQVRDYPLVSGINLLFATAVIGINLMIDLAYGYLDPQDLLRLETFAEWDWFPCEGGSIYDTNTDPEAAAQLADRLPGHDALIVCWGAPTLTADLLDMAPTLKFIGELEGDRPARPLDLAPACARGLRTGHQPNPITRPDAIAMPRGHTSWATTTVVG